MKDFYADWLSIPPGVRPPDHYSLLGVRRFCRDEEAIETATRARLERLDEYAMHPDRATRDVVQDMMNAVARARMVLVNPKRRQAYDQELARRFEAAAAQAVQRPQRPVQPVAPAQEPVRRVEPAARPRGPTAPVALEPWPPPRESGGTEADVREFEARVRAHLRRWPLTPNERRLLMAEAAGYGIDANVARKMILRIARKAETRERITRWSARAVLAVLVVVGVVFAVGFVWARSDRAQRERQFESNISQARKCLAGEDPVGAWKHLAEADVLRGGHPDVVILREELTAKRVELCERLESLIGGATGLMRRGDMDSAADSVAQVRSTFSKIIPPDDRFGAPLRGLEEEWKKRQVFEALLAEAKAEGNHVSAWLKCKKAEKLFPKDPRLRKLLTDLRKWHPTTTTAGQRSEALAKCLDDVRKALGDSDFELARKKLADAEQMAPGNQRIKTLRTKVEAGRKEALDRRLETVHKLVALANFPEAGRELAAAERLFPGDREIERVGRTIDAKDNTVRAHAALVRRVKLVVAELPLTGLAVSESLEARIAAAIRDARAAAKLLPGDKAAADLLKTLLPYAPLTLNLGADVSMKLRLIPAGQFLMGSPPWDAGARPNETPQRQVTISPGAPGFYLGATEVTQGQWRVLMGTEPWTGKPYVKEGADCAVSYVSWHDAVRFCVRLSAKAGRTVRLPTEAEWEYACRAGSKTLFSFGNGESKLSDHAWYAANAWSVDGRYAHRVARKKPNAWCLYDMHGNVWEWCADWYGEKYYAAADNNVDPTGPDRGARRVIRGGAFSYVVTGCCSAYRSRERAEKGSFSCGFRVASPALDRERPG